MNIYQRIVLILGAISLIIIMLISPDVNFHSNLGAGLETRQYAHISFTIIIRIIVFTISTLFIFFALKSIKK